MALTQTTTYTTMKLLWCEGPANLESAKPGGGGEDQTPLGGGPRLLRALIVQSQIWRLKTQLCGEGRGNHSRQTEPQLQRSWGRSNTPTYVGRGGEGNAVTGEETAKGSSWAGALGRALLKGCSLCLKNSGSLLHHLKPSRKWKCLSLGRVWLLAIPWTSQPGSSVGGIF